MPETITRVRDVPFQLDAMAHPDFHSKLPAAFHDEVDRYDWGIAVAAMDDAWDEVIAFEGIDWKVSLFPPNEMMLPKLDHGGATQMLPMTQHGAFLTVSLKRPNANEARDLGRPRVRSLLGLMRREIPMILPAQVLWEGAVGFSRSEQVLLSAVDMDVRPDRKVTQKKVNALRMRLVPLDLAKAPQPAIRALEWLAAARAMQAQRPSSSSTYGWQ